MTKCEKIRKALIIPRVLIQICVMIGLPIAMIAIGSVYLHDCGRAPLIPHYLIVYGCTLILMSVFAIIMILSLCSGAGLTFTIVVFVLLILFNVAWLITGSVWVFGTRYDYDSERMVFNTTKPIPLVTVGGGVLPSNATTAHSSLSNNATFTTSFNTTTPSNGILYTNNNNNNSYTVGYTVYNNINNNSYTVNNNNNNSSTVYNNINNNSYTVNNNNNNNNNNSYTVKNNNNNNSYTLNNNNNNSNTSVSNTTSPAASSQIQRIISNNEARYCNPTLHTFAYAVTIALYACMVLQILCTGYQTNRREKGSTDFSSL